MKWKSRQGDKERDVRGPGRRHLQELDASDADGVHRPAPNGGFWNDYNSTAVAFTRFK